MCRYRWGVNPCTKLWGHRPFKIWEDKKRPKIPRDLRQLSNLSTNISRMQKDIGKRLTAFWITKFIYFTLNAKKLEDSGLLITKLCLLIPTYPSSTVCAFSKNLRLWSHISGKGIVLSINEKRRLQLQSITRRTQQKWWTRVHKQSSVVSFWTTQV